MNDPQPEGHHLASHIERRKFLATLGGAAAAWPLAARAQPAAQVARIGVLNTGLDDAVSGGLGYRAFVAELQKLGFAEGRNLIIDYGRTDLGAASPMRLRWCART